VCMRSVDQTNPHRGAGRVTGSRVLARYWRDALSFAGYSSLSHLISPTSNSLDFRFRHYRTCEGASMCYINWRPDYWDEPQHPEPRPLPRLTWATPVDIIELGASLQAYSNLIPQVTTLRLAHRFGGGPLSTLPQEILDHVISDAQEMEKDKVRPKWNEGYRCFSGRCTRGSHHVASEQHTVRLWDELFGSGCGCGGGCGGLGLNSDDYDLEQKANMVVEYFEQDEDDGDFDEMVWDVHNDRQNAWVQQVCLCRRDANPSLKASKFGPLNEVRHLHLQLSLESSADKLDRC
jgi:hypothetical protein